MEEKMVRILVESGIKRRKKERINKESKRVKTERLRRIECQQ